MVYPLVQELFSFWLSYYEFKKRRRRRNCAEWTRLLIRVEDKESRERKKTDSNKHMKRKLKWIYDGCQHQNGKRVNLTEKKNARNWEERHRRRCSRRGIVKIWRHYNCNKCSFSCCRCVCLCWLLFWKISVAHLPKHPNCSRSIWKWNAVVACNVKWKMAIQLVRCLCSAHAKAHFKWNDKMQFVKKTEEESLSLLVVFFSSSSSFRKNACNLIRE